ncbi:X-Pro dipeptidase [Aureobasidium sp. EXF-8846]|nr:X-Pro dipeptidase [Aureobasidium sp. EXF-8846]
MEKFDIDACKPSTEVNSYLTSPETARGTIFAIPKQVADHITFLSFEETNWDLLKNAIEICRVVKDEHEIGLIRHANAISSHAHTEVMRMVKNARNERELMGTFVGACISNGGREQAYGCICASGPSAATLHYVHNDLPLSEKLNLLIDAGCEYNCYCSDITRTYPLQGKFTKESREIYDIVDEMQSECMKALKANVTWEDLHALAHEIAIDGLRRLGVLTGGNKKELFDSRVSTLFLPHGLGHYLGMDTHDSGGNANYEDPDPMFRYLRIRGTVPANSVVTVEPGIYFCRFIIEPALKEDKYAKYIDKAILERYWDVGGVRIEDDLWVKEDGCENLTTAPRSWDEVEALIHSV